jgi:hypothetical protein
MTFEVKFPVIKFVSTQLEAKLPKKGTVQPFE